jgi:hypothetical protein
MTTKHTPGPWSVGGSFTGPRASATVWLDYYRNDEGVESGHREGFVGITHDRRLVAIVPCGEGDAHADARLLAAAPDLLAACELTLKLLSDYAAQRAIGPVGVEIDALTAAIALTRPEVTP